MKKMFCENCGAKIPEHYDRCLSCGTYATGYKLSENTVAQAKEVAVDKRKQLNQIAKKIESCEKEIHNCNDNIELTELLKVQEDYQRDYKKIAGSYYIIKSAESPQQTLNIKDDIANCQDTEKCSKKYLKLALICIGAALALIIATGLIYLNSTKKQKKKENDFNYTTIAALTPTPTPTNNAILWNTGATTKPTNESEKISTPIPTPEPVKDKPKSQNTPKPAPVVTPTPKIIEVEKTITITITPEPTPFIEYECIKKNTITYEYLFNAQNDVTYYYKKSNGEYKKVVIEKHDTYVILCDGIPVSSSHWDIKNAHEFREKIDDIDLYIKVN